MVRQDIEPCFATLRVGQGGYSPIKYLLITFVSSPIPPGSGHNFGQDVQDVFVACT